jgi:hypothetical protein
MLAQMKALLFDGGLKIATSISPAESWSSAEEVQVIAYTLIQPDGDVMTFISPSYAGIDNWVLHISNVQRELSQMHRLVALLNLTLWSAIVPAFIVAVFAWRIFIRGPEASLVFGLMASFLMTLILSRAKAIAFAIIKRLF